MITINRFHWHTKEIEMSGLDFDENGKETRNFFYRVKYSTLNNSEKEVYDAFDSILRNGFFIQLLTNKYQMQFDVRVDEEFTLTAPMGFEPTEDELAIIDNFYNTFLKGKNGIYKSK